MAESLYLVIGSPDDLNRAVDGHVEGHSHSTLEHSMPDSSSARPKLFEIERRTIAPIPDGERHGKPRELSAIWFGMNMTPLTVVTGALATTLFGLSLPWALLAVVIGNVVGGVGMALHAAQGPTMGIPQMIQARGQLEQL
jgi:purine-cytosine permease-like protein